MGILLFVLILSVLVFVHELGHFWAARRFGIAVEEFGFGFPPRLWGKKFGSTVFSINLIPFGGFVRLQGESDDATARPDSFIMASGAKKFLALAAGVIMNYLLAWVLFSVILMAGTPVDPATAPHDRWSTVRDASIQAIVSKESAAAKAGLRTGMEITAVDGQSLASTDQIIAYTKDHQYPPIKITAKDQAGQEYQYTVTPDNSSTPPKYGFGIQPVGRLQYPWYVAPWYGLRLVGSVTAQTFSGFGQLVSQLVTQGKVSSDLTGPIGIAVLTGEIQQLGWVSLLQFAGLLSVSLAVLNFLPLPALDGGRALFVLIESILKRPINRRVESYIHAAGFYLLLAMIVVISVRDFQRFDILQRIGNIFR